MTNQIWTWIIAIFFQSLCAVTRWIIVNDIWWMNHRSMNNFSNGNSHDTHVKTMFTKAVRHFFVTFSLHQKQVLLAVTTVFAWICWIYFYWRVCCVFALPSGYLLHGAVDYW